MAAASENQSPIRIRASLSGPPVYAPYAYPYTSMRAALLACSALCSVVAVAPEAAMAQPKTPTVISGNVTFKQNGNEFDIIQTSAKAQINWQNFSIAKGEAVKFIQLDKNSIALNRVIGGFRSDILGWLSANGQVWIINPQGVFFGPHAKVKVAGLVATTHDITPEDFDAGRYIFKSDIQPNGIIENQGRITISDAGLAAFVAPGVVNHGVITARLGQIALAAGNQFTIDLYGDQKITLAMDNKVAAQVLGNDGKPLDALVRNDGKIFADGGSVQITAAAAKGLIDTIISVGGIVQARSVEEKNGEIILSGEGEGGDVQVGGTLDASGKKAGQTGGKVTVTGHSVTINAGARIDVSGNTGGGQALIGGDFRGGNAAAADYEEYDIIPAHKPVPPAETTTVASGATISADARVNGKGGEVIVWSTDATSLHGALSARGGSQGGDGGFIETSGSRLDVGGTSVSTKATAGTNGHWLLDPYSITIAASNATGTPFTASYTSGATSTILAGDITTALLSGSVTIQTGGSSGDGHGNGDITVNSPIAWSNNQLTLNAFNNIYINSALNGSGTAKLSLLYGQGAVAADNTSTYSINMAGGGVVNLPYGNNFSTTLGSDGTPVNYLVITSLGQQGSTSGIDLQGINGNLSGNYALGHNIDASLANTWDSGAGFTPIGNNSTKFSGTFDGLGHTIDSLMINQPSGTAIGLFKNSSGVISNLGLTNANVTGKTDVGMLAGESWGTIINSYAIGSVTGGLGALHIGGLVGYDEPYAGPISSSYASGSVSGGSAAQYIGGLVGSVN